MNYVKTHPLAKTPTKAYDDGSVGYDFYTVEDVVLPALSGSLLDSLRTYNIQDLLSSKEFPINNVAVQIRTGIAMELPENHVGLFRDRSGYGIRSIVVSAGVIDPNYRGEMIVSMINLNASRIEIPRGAKFVQMLILPVYDDKHDRLVKVDVLSTTVRGVNKFGSSGG